MTAERIFMAHDAKPREDPYEALAAKIEAAMVPRSGLKRRDLVESFASVLDPTTVWYRRWYFLLRLDEELEIARPKERPIALVGIKIPVMAEGMVTEVSDRLRERLARIANELLRPGDFPGCIADEQLAIYLPATDWLEALPIAERLGEELQAFAPQLAIASDDGRNALELLMAVMAEEPKKATVIELEPWRRRHEVQYLL